MDYYQSVDTPVHLIKNLDKDNSEIIGLKLISENTNSYLVGISWFIHQDSNYKNFHNIPLDEVNLMINEFKRMKPEWSNELDNWLNKPKQIHSIEKLTK